jgi:hypothetical protein
VFVAQDAATSCKDNELLYGEKDATGTLRTNDAVYQVKDFGENADTVTISGLGIRSSVDGCKFSTVFEYMDEDGRYV